MGRLDDYGHKAVFFIDPMPALVYGEQIIADMVGPVVERGHEVQLHMHTEWLEWAKDSPVEDRWGRNGCSNKSWRADAHCFSGRKFRGK
jgi:hypothetical protein